MNKFPMRCDALTLMTQLQVNKTSLFAAELFEHDSSMQAGFNAYALTVKNHSSMLIGVQKEIQELKQAKSEKDAAIRELQNASKEKSARISTLETRINAMQGINGSKDICGVSCAEYYPHTCDQFAFSGYKFC